MSVESAQITYSIQNNTGKHLTAGEILVWLESLPRSVLDQKLFTRSEGFNNQLSQLSLVAPMEVN